MSDIVLIGDNAKARTYSTKDLCAAINFAAMFAADISMSKTHYIVKIRTKSQTATRRNRATNN